MYKSAAQLLYGSVLVIFYYSLHLMCVYILLVQRLNTLHGFNPAQGRSLRAVPCTSSNYFPLSVTPELFFMHLLKTSYFILLRSSVLRLLLLNPTQPKKCSSVSKPRTQALKGFFGSCEVCCNIQCFAAKGENKIYLRF